MRWFIALNCVLVLAVAPAAAAPDQCDDPVNNSTQELCDEIKSLEQRNGELRNNVTELQGEIEKLEFEINQSDGLAIRQEMRAMGAWHPDNNEPAVLVVRIQDPNAQEKQDKFGVFQYVGPGNGGTSFNGQNAWTKIPLEKTGDNQLAPIQINLKYAPSGINTTQTYAVENAADGLRRLESRINGQPAFIRWTRWNNDRRNSAETVEQTTILATVGMLGLSLIGGVFVEAKTKKVSRWLQRKRKERNTGRWD